MSINKKISLLCFIGMFITACQTVNIPKSYDFKPSEISGNPYGCWVDIKLDSATFDSDNKIVSGELICIDSDTLFLLDQSSHLRTFRIGDIRQAELYTHANQSRQYQKRTLIFFAPNLLGAVIYAAGYGGGFLMLGIPVALVGVTQILIEGNSEKNILRFPGQSTIENLKMYARFPGARPWGVNFNELKLKPESF